MEQESVAWLWLNPESETQPRVGRLQTGHTASAEGIPLVRVTANDRDLLWDPVKLDGD